MCYGLKNSTLVFYVARARRDALSARRAYRAYASDMTGSACHSQASSKGWNHSSWPIHWPADPEALRRSEVARFRRRYSRESTRACNPLRFSRCLWYDASDRDFLCALIVVNLKPRAARKRVLTPQQICLRGLKRNARYEDICLILLLYAMCWRKL